MLERVRRIAGEGGATRVARAALVAAGALGAGAAPAAAQDGARQRIDFTFEARQPGVASAVRLDIDYVNPADPAAKPFAVSTLVEQLAPGARIDTSVPARCAASDAELMSRGAGACPAGSRVGGGELDVDTGIAGPARIVRSRVTLLNNRDELILLVEQEGGSRVVSRAPVRNGAFHAAAPPLPGGPPDGYSAIRRVRTKLDRIVANGRGYVTTPPTCPASGAWTSTIAFTYRDGVSQTSSSASSCDTPPPGPRVDVTRPRILVRGLPRRCADTPFLARVSILDASPLARVVARLDGRAVRRTRARSFAVRIDRRGLRTGRHRLRIAARDRAGNLAIRTVAFRRCARR